MLSKSWIKMSIKPIKILSIEDDEFMRIFLRDVFWMHSSPEDFKFDVLENIKKAKEFLKDPKNKPDLILLDMMVSI